MEIITKLSALGIDQDITAELVSGNTQPIIEEVFSTLKDAFESQAADREAYLYENYEPDNYHFGALEAEFIKQRAAAWMSEIKNEFIAAVDGVCHISKNGRLPTPEEVDADNQQTYRLSCAARELDNSWYDFATHAVYLENSNGYPYFQVHLPDADLVEIFVHPEQYLIVDVYVK